MFGKKETPLAGKKKRKRDQKWVRIVRSKTFRRTMVGGVAIATVLGAIAIVVVLSVTSGNDTIGPAPQQDTGLFLLGGNDSRKSITNGSSLTIGQMTARVQLADLRVKSSMDIYVTDSAGVPVTDAEVTVLPSMPMPGQGRGFMTLRGVPQEAGHYAVSWQLPMPAAWNLYLQVKRSAQLSSIELLAFLT